jgi:hypothetical protein
MSKVATEYDSTKTWSGLEAPSYWHIVERGGDGLMWRRLRGEAISVIESTSKDQEGRTWLHVSVAKPSDKKLATYQDLEEARKLFIGEERECYMIFPPKERYVNIKPVMHLWACLDAPKGVLPQFEGMVVLEGREQLSV